MNQRILVPPIVRVYMHVFACRWMFRAISELHALCWRGHAGITALLDENRHCSYRLDPARQQTLSKCARTRDLCRSSILLACTVPLHRANRNAQRSTAKRFRLSTWYPSPATENLDRPMSRRCHSLGRLRKRRRLHAHCALAAVALVPQLHPLPIPSSPKL